MHDSSAYKTDTALTKTCFILPKTHTPCFSSYPVSVFLFRISKDSLDGLLSHGINLSPALYFTGLLHNIQIFLPYMGCEDPLPLFIGSAEHFAGTCFATFRGASVGALSTFARGRMAQSLPFLPEQLTQSVQILPGIHYAAGIVRRVDDDALHMGL